MTTRVTRTDVTPALPRGVHVLTVRERVDRGVALLDEHTPDWREHVDPLKLHMQLGCRCILGQVFGRGDLAPNSGYAHGIIELGLWDDDLAAWQHGFSESLSNQATQQAWDDAWARLLAEWLRRLS